jgi:hypothetical protein
MSSERLPWQAIKMTDVVTKGKIFQNLLESFGGALSDHTISGKLSQIIIEET